MRLSERQRQLDTRLLAFRQLWHPQPFREIRPAWCEQWPALLDELLALPDTEAVRLNDDGTAALALLARHLPDVAALQALADWPVLPATALKEQDRFWAWEIPGRKRQQIEAFAAKASNGGQPVLDWCGGKGHLGRLLAQQWQTPVHTLEIDPVLCAAGEELARRGAVDQQFVVADALAVGDWPKAGGHAVALHACGELHRRLIRRGVEEGAARLDVAPCCYYRGVDGNYQPLSEGLSLVLSRDDTRLAVTETVTAAAREARNRDRAMAWKLGFDAWRRAETGSGYRSFKPVPDAWMRGGFADFLSHMSRREGLPQPAAKHTGRFEELGWQRWRDVRRLAIVRHAFRRLLESWLVLDLAVFLEGRGYVVEVGVFCERSLSPRNLLVSAERA